MDYRQELISMIDKFNVQSVEEFKEIELKIIADSKSIFKKNKDYDGHIAKLKKIKGDAQRLNPRSIKIPQDDKLSKDLIDNFQRCLIIFSGVCDGYIQFETALKGKAEGDKTKFSEIKQINDKVRFAKTNLNNHLNELNIIYSEFNEMDRGDEDEEDLEGIAYMTYESLK